MIGKVVDRDDFTDVFGVAAFEGRTLGALRFSEPRYGDSTGAPILGALPGRLIVLVLVTALLLGCGRPATAPEVTAEPGSPSPAASPVSKPSPSPTSPPPATLTPTTVPPTPTLIPPPPLSGAAATPSAPAPSSTARSTLVPTSAPTATTAPAGPTIPPSSEASERVRVSGTEGLGANLREQPGTQGALLKTLRDGAELTVLGADRQVGDQAWRNVRDDEGTVGWVVAEALERIGPTPTPSPADAAAPCRIGQLKGDAASGLFYSSGHPDYASKKDRVRCFDAEPQARASGFQPAP